MKFEQFLRDDTQLKLECEVEKAMLAIYTDSYTMSIGELANLYEDGELDIHPEFQRVYRWNNYQKSKFIESILLGIPLPSIFVAQNDNGVWDVVDGLQRLSTIFEFMGKLKDENGDELPELKLNETKYLPSLKDIRWSNLSSKIKLIFKRARMDIKIVSRKSDSDSKFELFQRLNTGGSELKPQEIRNCLLLMINKSAFKFIKDCSEDIVFRETLPITERKENESYYSELATRFFIQRKTNLETLKKYEYANEYLDDELVRIFSESADFNYQSEKIIFKKTFELLNQALGEDSFRKYNSEEQKYKGAISLPIFEVISTAVSQQIEDGKEPSPELIQEKSKELPNTPDFIESLRANNTRPMQRTITMLKLSKSILG